jgi:cytoskeletal protein CcmA (bactofilin family)
MLGKDKKMKTDHPSDSNKFLELKSFTKDSSQMKRNEKSIISENIAIEGDIRGHGNLVIEGSVKGNIELEDYNFAIGPTGNVEGKIYAQDISISGQMAGNIEAKGKVEITRSANFMGEIHACGIAVENGADFNGTVELNRGSRKKTVTDKTATKMRTSQSQQNHPPQPAQGG